MFCFCFGYRDRTVKVFETMTFEQFYEKFFGTIISDDYKKALLVYK
jgi:hypothetical protein